MKIAITSANSGDLTFPFGKTVPAHGEITIDAAELETCRDNPVVRYWFENRMLSAAPVDDIDDGPVDDQNNANRSEPNDGLPAPEGETPPMPAAPEVPAAPPEHVFITDPAPEPVVVEPAPVVVEAPEPIVEPAPAVEPEPALVTEPVIAPPAAPAVVEPVRHHGKRRG